MSIIMFMCSEPNGFPENLEETYKIVFPFPGQEMEDHTFDFPAGKWRLRMDLPAVPCDQQQPFFDIAMHQHLTMREPLHCFLTLVNQCPRTLT